MGRCFYIYDNNSLTSSWNEKNNMVPTYELCMLD
jgi:hypothetical protein